MNFILKLVLGIIAGIIIGFFAPESISRILITFEHLFNEFLGFVIPFIIFFFIGSGITSLQRNSGQILGLALGAAYISTILAGLFAATVGIEVMSTLSSPETLIEPTHHKLEPYFSVEMTPFADVTSALIGAFIFGVGASTLRFRLLGQLLGEGKEITELLINKMILPLLPLYIACIFANFTTQGSILEILQAFGLILLFAVSLHWCWIFILYSAAGLYAKRNVFASIRNMLPAYMTGVGTMSSVATIPVALKQTEQNGVSKGISNFTIPLFANIHLCGSTITITICSLAVMVLTQQAEIPNLWNLIPFILTLGIIMVAAPGVPGGAVMSALGILASMLGFGELALGLMIALYIAQDSFSTACNVTGDGALAIIIDKYVHKKELLVPSNEVAPATSYDA